MYTFEEKNQITQRITSGEHFHRDKELYTLHCSNARLDREIARANVFTMERLDARIVFMLLDHLTEQQIINHRLGTHQPATQKVLETVKEATKSAISTVQAEIVKKKEAVVRNFRALTGH